MPADLFSQQSTQPYIQSAVMQQLANDSAGTVAPNRPDQKTGMSKGALLTMLLGQGADLGTTAAALHSGQFHESNHQGLPLVLAEKAAIMGLAPLIAKHLPRAGANALGYGVGAAGAVPAAMNASKMAGQK